MSIFLHRAGLMIPAPPAPVTSVSFHASATATGTGTLTVPATVQAGDILVFKDHATGSGITIPTNFTSLANADSAASGTRCVLSFKIASGSEGGTSLVGITPSSQSRRELLVFRGNAPANSVTAHSPAGEGTNGNPAAQVIASAAGVVPLVAVASYNSGAAVDPRSFSPAEDAEVTSNTNSFFKYKIYNSSPADITVDMDDEGLGNILVSAFIQVS